MSQLLRLCSVLPVVLCVSLTACASGRAHENFKNSVQWDVGKSLDDQSILMNRYPEDQGELVVLPNGNIEQQYRFRRGCTVYFETDKASRKIVGWRYEGTEETCVLVP